MHAEQAYLFRHALLRDAAYELQPPGDRARLHNLALEILELVLDEAARAELALELAGHARGAAQGAEGDARASLLRRELGHLGNAAERARAGHRHADEAELCARLIAHEQVAPLPLVQARLQLADACKHLGRTLDSLQAARQALHEAEQLGEPSLQVAALRAQAGAQETMGQYEQAAETLAEALQRLGPSGAPALRCELSLAAATIDHAAGEHARAEARVRETCRKARELGLSNLELKGLQLLGAVLLGRRCFEESIATSRQALKLLEQAGDQAGQAIALTNMGACLQLTDDAPAARDVYLRALKLAEASGSRRGQAVLLNNLGTLSDRQDPAFAERCYIGAIEAAREVSDPRRELFALNGLSYVYLRTGRWDAAVDCAEQAIRLGERSGRPELAAVALLNRGHIRAQRGDAEGARQDLLPALQVFENAGHWERALKCCINLNEVAVARNDMPEARRWKDHADRISRDSGIPLSGPLQG